MALNVADQLVENLRAMLAAAAPALGLPATLVVRAAAEDAARTLPCVVAGYEAREREVGMTTTWRIAGWLDYHTLLPATTADAHRDAVGVLEDWLLGITQAGPVLLEKLYVHALLAEPSETSIEDRVQSTRIPYLAVVTQAA